MEIPGLSTDELRADSRFVRRSPTQSGSFACNAVVFTQSAFVCVRQLPRNAGYVRPPAGSQPTRLVRMDGARVEDWRGVPKVWPSVLLPASSGSASLAEP